METREELPNLLSIEKSEIEFLMPLDIDTVRELWSRTYNSSGKPDWTHIYPYYHPEVVFEDSVQRVEGIKDFVALCERLTKRCESLQMEILSIAQGANFILMDWIMTMSFNKYPRELTLEDIGRHLLDQRHIQFCTLQESAKFLEKLVRDNGVWERTECEHRQFLKDLCCHFTARQILVAKPLNRGDPRQLLHLDLFVQVEKQE